MVEESLLLKIKKLWKKANSAKAIGSIEEAEAFFTKANELLANHNLTHIDLDKVKDDKSFIKESDPYICREKGGYDWKFHFICQICYINFCEAIFHCGGKTYTIIGSKDNIEITKEFIDYLIPIVQVLAEQRYLKRVIQLREKYHVISNSFSMARILFLFQFSINIKENQIMPESYKKEMKDKQQKYYIKDIYHFFKLDKSKFLSDFSSGFASGLKSKIDKERKSKEPEIQNNITSLIVLHKEMVTKYIDEKYPEVKERNNKVNHNGNAFAQGYIEGNKLDLNKKIQTQDSNLLN